MTGESLRPSRGRVAVGIRPSSPYVIEIECLRGIAVLLVYLFHVDLFVMGRFFAPAGTVVSPALAFVSGGYTGVSLFFVISGFLLGGHFLDEIAGGSPLSRRRYAARRALRILPLYYVAVVVGSVLAARTPADVLRGVPYLVFLNAFGRFAIPIGSFSGVWWSLATEVQFYVLLPLVVVLLRPGSWRWLAVCLLLAYGGVYAAFVSGRGWTGTLERALLLGHSLFGQGPLFGFGMFAAWIHRRAGGRLADAAWVRCGLADGLLLAVLLGLAAVLRWTLRVGPIRDLPPYLAWHLPEGLLWTAVLLLLLAPLRLKPLFQNRALAWLGTISYSVYLVHVPVIAALGGVARAVAPFALVGWSWSMAALVSLLTAACLVVSWGTHVVIERPFLTRKARL